MFANLLSDRLDPFYQNIASFPTAVFTFFLAVCVLYWLAAILGVVDIDFLDFDLPESMAEPGLNQASDLPTSNVLAGLLLRFGLQGVPVTIILTFIALIGWLICYYLVHFLLALVPGGFLRYVAGLPVLAASLYMGALVTSLVIKPLRPFFTKAQQGAVKQLLGQKALVRTSKVTNTFGEAVLEDGGAGLILKVRTIGEQAFRKGDVVILLEYRAEDNTYRVISESEFMNSGLVR